MPDKYIQLEVDELGHEDHSCFNEDVRLEIIAANVGLPGIVVRINPDQPQCFNRRKLANGQHVEQFCF